MDSVRQRASSSGRLPRTLVAIAALVVASLAAAAPSQAAKLFVIPTSDPGGPGASGPVVRYDVAGPASSPTLDTTIVDPTFDRPCCLTFSASGEMFVSNRGDGVSPGAGSITRIVNPQGASSPNGTITSPTFHGPHWATFRRGELFVAQRGGRNVLRFLFDAGGNASFNGAIPVSTLDGPRGVAVSPTGELFVALCCGLNRIKRYVFDGAGNATPNGEITGGGLRNPNDIAFSRSGELFAANAFGDSVSRFKFDPAGNASPNGQITGATLHGPTGLDFSPWGELFVGNGFPPSGVSRFLFDSAGTATFNGFFSTPPDALIDIQFGPPPGPGSFLYYPIEAGTPAFQKRTVTIRDQFRTSQAQVVEPLRLLNPVSTDGGAISRPGAHLKCYRIEEPQFSERTVTVENQFGTRTLPVKQPTRLCNPASKKVPPGTPPPVPSGLDHFRCYGVEGSPVNRPVTLRDQFGRQEVVVQEPEYLCNPASKNGSPIGNPAGHLVCYELGGVDPFASRRASLRDQFGVQTFDVVRPTKLCVPSRKRP